MESRCKELEAQLEEKGTKGSKDGDKSAKQIEKLSSALTEHVVCSLPRFPPLSHPDHSCSIGEGRERKERSRCSEESSRESPETDRRAPRQALFGEYD